MTKRAFFPAEALNGLWAATDQAGRNGRPILTGVHMDGRGFLVATDGFLLAVRPVSIDFDGEPFSTTIPSVFRRCKLSGTMTIDAEAETAEAFDKKEGTVIGKLYTAEYPRWETIIPKPEPGRTHVPTVFDPKMLSRLATALDVEAPAVFAWERGATAIAFGPDGQFGLIAPRSEIVPGADEVLLRLSEIATRLSGHRAKQEAAA